MKYIIYIFLLSLFSPKDKIMEQGSSSVTIADIDSYVYLLEPAQRAGFINDKDQIEKNLITMLNINIVNNYIESNGISNDLAFLNIEETVKNLEVDLDDEFYLKLGLDKGISYENVKDFIVKKERFIRMSDVIKNQLLNGALNDYIKEYFIVNKSRFLKPESRKISLMKFKTDVYKLDEIKSTLNGLLEDDSLESLHHIIETNLSKKDKVQFNHITSKEFIKSDFTFPFVKQVFDIQSIGVIPKIFKFEGYFYITRIDEIIKEKAPKFEDYKDELTDELLPEIVQAKLQRIINSQAKHKININEEVVAHVFERYKVLLED